MRRYLLWKVKTETYNITTITFLYCQMVYLWILTVCESVLALACEARSCGQTESLCFGFKTLMLLFG